MLVNVLHVAEKPSVAKEVAKILSKNNYQNIYSESKYNPVYQFEMNFMNQQSLMHFTSVTGHIMGLQFHEKYKNWKTIDPLILFTQAEVIKVVDDNKKDIVSNLQHYSKKANTLVLWLDCDREGEAIAIEVQDICLAINPKLLVKRAHFSALTQSDINKAINNLREVQKNLAEAVDARQNIDLRIGAAFTRFQTLTLQQSFNGIQKIVSYGPCQFPTLGFVVDRFQKIRDFKSEPYWYLVGKFNWINEQQQSKKQEIEFTWNRTRVQDEKIAQEYFTKCIQNIQEESKSETKSKKQKTNQTTKTINKKLNVPAKIIKIEQKQKTKYRPSPLATIQLQKIGTKKLKLSSHRIMEIAEKLYSKGYISYPRTETDQFSNTINLHEIMKIFKDSEVYGKYASQLIYQKSDDQQQKQVKNKFVYPRKGQHDDKAHPPIHPVRLLPQRNSQSNNENNNSNNGDSNFVITQEDELVYDLIARHFLACCSADAIADETYVEIQVNNQEIFSTKGLIIKEANFLEIYTFETWTDQALPPNLKVGDEIILNKLSMSEGKTTPPSLLTESELIGMMDKNGIGTDSTIHEHIKTIQEREYAEKVSQVFQPTNLGVALVEAYQKLGFTLSQPNLRALMEKKMQEIALGNLKKDTVCKEVISQMEEIFIKLNENKKQFIEYVGNAIKQKAKESGGEQSDQQLNSQSCGNCTKCGNPVAIIQDTNRVLKCNTCNYAYQLPKNGTIKKLDNTDCKYCGFPVYQVQNEKANYNICPHCFSNVPEEYKQNNNKNEIVSKILNPANSQLFMPCFKCLNKTCTFAEGYVYSTNLFHCPSCTSGIILKKANQNQKPFLGCSGFPKCRWVASLPSFVLTAKPTQEVCINCQKAGRKSLICQFTVNKNDESFSQISQNIKDRLVVNQEYDIKGCIYPGCDKDFEQYGLQVKQKNQFYNSQKYNKDNKTSNSFQKKYDKDDKYKSQNNQQQNKESANNKYICYICQKPGHVASRCPDKVNYQKSYSAYKTAPQSPKYSKNQKTEATQKQDQQGTENMKVNLQKQSNTEQTKIENVYIGIQKENKRKTIPCPVCGLIRHPKGSTCQGKSVKKSKSSED